jgi:4-amino-4-deoxy-L-arabinose transferase-like glycosyltransferase
MKTDEKLDLGILILISFLLSTYLFFQTYVIAMDGAFQHIPMAKMFATGSFREAINYSGQQPLYAILVSLVYRWAGDFELAARWVSSFFGIIIVFPVYFLASRISDRRVAFLTTLFLVIHPYVRRYSADALKESTYLFFFATAVWFALRAVQREQIRLFLFVPFFSGLAYLARPDGIEPLLAVFFYTIFVERFSVSGKKPRVIFLLFLSSGLLLLPYLLHLREVTGAWTLSKTKGMAAFLGLGMMKEGIPFVDKVLFALKDLNLEIIATVHPLYTFFLVIGFATKIRTGFKRGEGLLVVLWVLHYVVVFLLILNLTDWSANSAERVLFFSGRHALSLLLVSICWIGEGFWTSYQWVLMKAESSSWGRHWDSQRQAVIGWGVLLAITLAIILPKTLKPQRYERLSEKRIGFWIESQSGKGNTVFTTMPRVAYYADGVLEYFDFDKESLDQVHAAMVNKKAYYLVIREEEVKHLNKVAEPIRKSLVEAMRYEKKGMERIIVYRRTP